MIKRKGKKASPPVIIVSGASGASGRQIVETALAQFPMIHVPVIKVDHVRSLKQLEKAVKKASSAGGTVVHTLVERVLRDALIRLGKKHNVVTIDLMGPRLEQVAGHYETEPLEQPGLYRKVRKDYFDRVEAIDFAVAHDDGKKPEDLSSADIVIIGVSRCGKTPLSMYLAVYGWKVANVPIVKDIPLPEELYRTDRRRVVALTIDQEHLLEHRKRRKVRMGTIGTTDYTKPSAIFEELEAARKLYRDGGFHVISVTDKSIEIIADEIITFITRSLKEGRRKKVPL
jgi:regulator of PEP synthase PpsR (kinase-PPPase family)